MVWKPPGTVWGMCEPPSWSSHSDAPPPPPSQPASSLGGLPTTTSSTTGKNSMSGLLLLIGVVSGTSLVLLNVLLIGCCLHRRTKKRIMRRKSIVEAQPSTEVGNCWLKLSVDVTAPCSCTLTQFYFFFADSQLNFYLHEFIILCFSPVSISFTLKTQNHSRLSPWKSPSCRNW